MMAFVVAENMRATQPAQPPLLRLARKSASSSSKEDGRQHESIEGNGEKAVTACDGPSFAQPKRQSQMVAHLGLCH